MTKELPFGEREESLVDLWLFIIVNTTILALLINILSLFSGNNEVAPHLLYIPIVITAYWYPHRGLYYAAAVSAIYFILVFIITNAALGELAAAFITCVVLIGVAAIVSSLATHMRKNEVKYHGIFNNSEAGISLVSLSGLIITEVNRRLADMLGYTAADLTKIPFSRIWADEDDRGRFFSMLQTNGNVENFETQVAAKSGKKRWVLISAGVLPDDQFVCTIVDITARKEAEEIIIIKDYAISSSINAIAILDLDFAITYVNRSLLKMMEYSDEKELIGRNMQEIVVAKTGIDEIRDAFRKNGSWFGEILFYKFNRTPFYVLLWGNLVKDEKGNPICIMISFIDITDQKQMEATKRRALQQIEQNIEQFAILGDHIRNPLAVIVGLSSLAPGDITDKIIQQAKEIDRIITQLDMGWIESEKVREFIKRYYVVGAGETGADKLQSGPVK
jgi:PAS domain S-box-containing protein